MSSSSWLLEHAWKFSFVPLLVPLAVFVAFQVSDYLRDRDTLGKRSFAAMQKQSGGGGAGDKAPPLEPVSDEAGKLVLHQWTAGGAIAKSAKSNWVRDVLAESGGHECVLFSYIQQLHGGGEWGTVLDAGTGDHSLGWLLGLAPDKVVAVTGSQERLREMSTKFRGKLRAQDEIVCGNWKDEEFLKGTQYDVVVADYLLGALDGFAPYYQDLLFPRLRRHIGKYLFIVGQEPIPDTSDDVHGQVIIDVYRTRDACILLAKDGRRCYREYPAEWTMRHLQRAGFKIIGLGEFHITYTARYLLRQIAVGERKIPYMPESAREGMRKTLASLRSRVRALSWGGHVKFGKDYVIGAIRADASNTHTHSHAHSTQQQQQREEGATASNDNTNNESKNGDDPGVEAKDGSSESKKVK